MSRIRITAASRRAWFGVSPHSRAEASRVESAPVSSCSPPSRPAARSSRSARTSPPTGCATSSAAGIVRAIEAGAAGYLLKDASRADLAAAVRDVAAGRRVLSPEVAARLAAVGEVRPPVLSAREPQVLALVAEGLTNAEIGARLYIGQATVKTHLLHVFGKLGVSDRTAAVMAALEHGILPVP
ncbi:hypothetical protein GWI34_29445 [Actinomadura sp. DSM 109109]|nr:hypothetical protein [Actinomadura lepetitiana]